MMEVGVRGSKTREGGKPAHLPHLTEPNALGSSL